MVSGNGPGCGIQCEPINDLVMTLNRNPRRLITAGELELERGFEALVTVIISVLFLCSVSGAGQVPFHAF